LDEQGIVDAFLRNVAFTEDAAVNPYAVAVAEGSTARQALGNAMRTHFSQAFGHDLSHATDAEVLDALVYNVFPNFAPWGGFMPNIVYRWRPGKTVDTCLMEIRILARVAPGQPIPPGVEMQMLGPDQSWSECTAMGTLGMAIDQDQSNLPFVQEGLHASDNGKVQLGNYQELRIRHFHQTIDRYLDGAGARPGHSIETGIQS
jgi:hypothetical protein